MKRSVRNKESAYARATKKSRVCPKSVTSAGILHVDPLDTVLSTQSDSDEDVSPNVLLERLMTQKLERMVEKYCSTSRPQRNVSGEKIIPLFDPDNHEISVKNWLAKIDQLGLVHKWDDYAKIVIMQTRLAGQAQLWFSRLDEYNYTWDQWKSLLTNAFPRSFEYADMLEELVTRKKLQSESVTHYYHEKLAMCRRCRLDDAAALSCLIKGLPADLQYNARAFKCETPEEFYTGYLAAFENYRSKLDSRKNDGGYLNYPRITKPDLDKRRTQDLATIVATPMTSRSGLPTSRKILCFRCNSADHMVRDCPVPDKRICKFCGQAGHNINKCLALENLMKKARDDTVPINIIQSLNNIYKKLISVGGTQYHGYLDTGAQVNIITMDMAKTLNCPVTESKAMLQGFTGDTVPAMGQVNLTMQIDGLEFDTSAIITHMKLPGEVDILIGQPIINSEGISLITTQNSAVLKNNTMENQDTFDGKFKVTTCSEVQILPNESRFVEVNILGNSDDGNVCTTPRFYGMKNKYFAVPATLITGQKGHVRVYNMGSDEIKLTQGEMLVRAVPCTPTSVYTTTNDTLQAENTKVRKNL